MKEGMEKEKNTAWHATVFSRHNYCIRSISKKKKSKHF